MFYTHGPFLALSIPYLIYLFAGDWVCSMHSSLPWHRGIDFFK
jgi:hypothetical protein